MGPQPLFLVSLFLTTLAPLGLEREKVSNINDDFGMGHTKQPGLLGVRIATQAAVRHVCAQHGDTRTAALSSRTLG